jgi:hypothetical protein
MYLKSESFFGFPVDFEMTNKHAPLGKSFMGNLERKSIYGCFYLPMDDYRKILGKYTKNFRYSWRFPYRSEIYKNGEEFEQLKKDYEANPDNKELKEEYEWTVTCMERDKLWKEYYSQLKLLFDAYESKNISLKELHKQESVLAKKYGCQRRSREKEKVEFTVMDYSPNSNKEYYELVKKYYLKGAKDNLVDENDPNINKRALEDAKLAIQFANNISDTTKHINHD